MEEDLTQFGSEIDSFLDFLLTDRGASKHTVAAYRNDLTKAAQFFKKVGSISFSSIQGKEVVAFEESLGPPVAKATALRRVSSLRSLIKFLKRSGATKTDRLPQSSGFSRPKLLPKALTLEEVQKLMSTFQSDQPEGLRDRLLLELLYGCGLRISEAVSLRVSDVDMDGRVLRIAGKREKVRLSPIPNQTAAWLSRYLSEVRPTFVAAGKGGRRPEVLLTNGGKALLRQNAFKVIRLAATRAGIESAPSPHTLRHTYAVHLLKNGADLRALQELLGHESLASTQIYTTLDLEEVARRYRAAHPRSGAGFNAPKSRPKEAEK